MCIATHRIRCRGEMQLQREKKLPARFVLAKNYGDLAQLSLRASRDGADLIHCCLSRINVIIIRTYARRLLSLSLSKSSESIACAGIDAIHHAQQS